MTKGKKNVPSAQKNAAGSLNVQRRALASTQVESKADTTNAAGRRSSKNSPAEICQGNFTCVSAANRHQLYKCLPSWKGPDPIAGPPSRQSFRLLQPRPPQATFSLLLSTSLQL